MTTETLAANHVYFSKCCEFWHSNENAAVPMGKCSVGEFGDMLDAIGSDCVRVEFRTTSDPKEIAADVKKFSKRLAGLSSKWCVGQWEIEVIRGFEQHGSRICTLTRSKPWPQHSRSKP